MGKGSGRRPLLISEQEAQDNWDKIFKKEKNSPYTLSLHDALPINKVEKLRRFEL